MQRNRYNTADSLPSFGGFQVFSVMHMIIEYICQSVILLIHFVLLQPDEISFEEGDILYIIDRVNDV